MKILDRLTGALAGAAFGWKTKAGPESWIDQAFRAAADLDPLPQMVTKPYTQHPTVYRILTAFARNIARVPLEFKKPGSKDPIPNTPVELLFRKPNATLRGTQLIEATSLHLEHWGNCIWWLGEVARANAAGTVLPVSIRLVPPKAVDLKVDGRGDPELYRINTGAKIVPVPPEQIVHFRFVSPYSDLWGTTWLEAAAAEYETDWMGQQWNKKWFRRGAEPGGILMPKGEFNMTEPAAARLRQSWIERHRGLERAHAPAILPAGLEWVKTGMGQREMDFANLRRLSRENTLSAGGCPPAIAGILEYANYANMLPQLRLFFEIEILPRLSYIASMLNADFLDRFGTGLEAEFKTDVLSSLLEDLDMLTQVAARLFNMGVPLREINDRLKLNLDLTKVPTADESFLPAGIQLADTAVNPPPPPPAPAPPAPVKPGTPVDNPTPQETPAPEGEGGPGPLVRGRPHLTTGEKAALWRALNGSVRDIESKAESRWRGHVHDLQVHVLSHLRHRKSIEVPVQTRAPGEGFTAVLRQDDIDVLLWDLRDAQQESVIQFEPLWRASVGRGADSIERQTGIQIAFDFNDPAVLSLLSQRRMIIKGTDARMRSDLRGILAEGIDEHETEEELKQRVLSFFGGERANARTVARTEIFSAFSGGRFESMTQAGIERHYWLTSRDDRVRETHDAIDGQEVGVGDFFSIGVRYPLDEAGEPGETINCRCATVPVV